MLRVFSPPALAALAILLFQSNVAHAASTSWAESEGGNMRIVALAPEEDGTVRAVLQIALEPGWKTYWKEPGGSGIPPMLSIDGSSNLSGGALSFPAPKSIDDGYSVYAGYKHPVAFPIALRQDKPNEASTLEANVFIGICERICIPFQEQFTLDLTDGQADRDEIALVNAAYSVLPEPAGSDFAVDRAAVDADGGLLTVDVQLPAFRPAGSTPDLFVAGPPRWLFGPPRELATEGAKARFAVPVHGGPEGETLSGHDVDILVTSGQRAMETTVTVR